MIKILAKQICPFSSKCQYADNGINICQGTNSERNTIFTCSFCDKDGNIQDNKYRSSLDQTGNMRIIHG